MPIKPPPGYSLKEVPDFLKPTAANSKVVIQQPNGRDISSVSSSNPTEIDVHQREQFGQPQLNHEETHVFQFSRNPAVVAAMREVPIARDPKNPMASYTYGGTDGLLAAQQQHKTIADFNMEQQAEMVRNYSTEIKQAIARGDAAEVDKLNRAYKPYLNQLANLPGKNDSMTTMTQKDLTPAAPGLPPATESGILAPLKVIGGKAGVKLSHGYTLEK